MRTLFRPTAAAAGLVAVLLVAGCSSDAPADPTPGDTTSESPSEEPSDEPTVEPPAETGPLVVYSGRSEDLVAPLIEQFEADTGIEIEVRYGSTSEIAALLLEEGSASPAHVFLSQESGALGAVADAGLLSTLPEDVTSTVPADLTSQDGTWVGVTGRARVVVFDSEEVDEADVPTTAADIVDPRWSGQIAVAPGNASFKSFVTGLRILLGEDGALDWLEALAANDPQIFDGNGAILNAVNDGAAQIGLINHYYWFGLAADIGAENMRAQQVFGEAGDPAALINVTGAGVLTGAADRSDAQAFVAYLVTPEAQTYFAEQTYEYPLVPGIPGPEGVPALADLRGPELDLADLGTIAETDALLVQAGLL